METTSNTLEFKLTAIARAVLSELQAERALSALSLDARLSEDLGLGSLERAELFQRIEKEFSVQLSSQWLAQANSLRDLLAAIQQAQPKRQYQGGAFKAALEENPLDMSQALTLVEALKWYGQHAPSRPHLYLQDEFGNEETLTYGQLLNQACKVAQSLLHHQLKPGETVAIMLPTSMDFFYAFMGVLLAGGVPVPIYPPLRPEQIEEYIRREAGILQNAEVRVLIAFERVEALSRLLKTFIPSLTAAVTVPELLQADATLPEIEIQAHHPALIQYTSGSTGAPKGVLLLHQTLLNNIRAYGQGLEIKPQDNIVSWLPLYHDMGLIGAWLGSFYYGNALTVLSPLTFLARPERWLWAIHYHRATLSAGPNFAYELCVRKIEDSALEGLDLSCWRLAFNGAEAISPRTMERFSEKFARYGFQKEAMFPVYGLAESSVALAFPPVGRGPRVDRIARDPFLKEGKAVPDHGAGAALKFVCCGSPLPGHEIRIVNEHNQLLEERHVGLLQFRGPSAMEGYYRNPEATAAVYHEGWWDTGDYAYLAQGELYITGRKKDVIIKAGRNLYPTEIEDAVNQISGVRRGCVAAFGVTDEQRGTEKLVVVAEAHEQVDQQARQLLIQSITEAVNKRIGLPPDEVILAPARTIPKTSSGKLRRSTCKENYLAGHLTATKVPVWLQFSKLYLQGIYKRIKRGLGKSLRFLYTLYAVLMTIITGFPFLAVLMLMPERQAGRFARFWAKTLLGLIGCRLKIKGREHLTAQAQAVFISNHASYLDAIVLAAFLPADTAFVAKKELDDTPIIKYILRKLRYPTVDRLDYQQSLADTQKIQTILAAGRSIMLFPEGTFAYATGVRPFKLGAFKLAAEAKLPICPIALKGMRTILRSGSFLLKPGRIEATVLAPVIIPDTELQTLASFSKVIRKQIAQHVGEAGIDLIEASVALR